ncbi:hypothetical protein GCM10022260_06170 [Gaetbulibacter aestuarii]
MRYKVIITDDNPINIINTNLSDFIFKIKYINRQTKKATIGVRALIIKMAPNKIINIKKHSILTFSSI